MSEPVPTAMDKIAQLAITLGVTPISNFDECWEHQIDEQWFVAVNGHGDRRTTTREGGPTGIPPWHAYVEFNGWPAGIISPGGGTFAAGIAANEDTFISAIDRAITEAKQ